VDPAISLTEKVDLLEAGTAPGAQERGGDEQQRFTSAKKMA
jgi:hypothetical protein